MSALVDREGLLSATQVREDDALRELGVAQRSIATQGVVIQDLRSNLT